VDAHAPTQPAVDRHSGRNQANDLVGERFDVPRGAHEPRSVAPVLAITRLVARAMPTIHRRTSSKKTDRNKKH